LSYVVKYLREKDDIKLELKSNSDNIGYYAKYSSFIGPSESIKYIKKKLKNFRK